MPSPNKVQGIRVRRLMTQEELAAKAGISVTTLSFIENGLREPIDLTKQKIANAFELEVDQVFPPAEESKR